MKAARIIVPSGWVKSALLRQFNRLGEKVTVIYEGVSDRFRTRADDRLKARLIRQYQLTDRFLLYVGNIEPKKNLPLLLSVFDRLKSRYRSLKLVICGRIGWKRFCSRQVPPQRRREENLSAPLRCDSYSVRSTGVT